MAGASGGRGVPAAAVLALRAGCDLLCLGADKTADDLDSVVTAIVDAVKDGTLAEPRLVEAAQRVHTATRTVHGWRGAGAFPDVDESAAREAAHRALRVDGVLPELTDGTLVVRFRTGTNVAVGQVPWGLPLHGSVLGGRQPSDVSEDADIEEVVRQAAASGVVVALVREAHRHPWVADRLRRLAKLDAALVVVEMGWPGPEQLPGAATVWTYGASRANGAALDELLARVTGGGR